MELQGIHTGPASQIELHGIICDSTYATREWARFEKPIASVPGLWACAAERAHSQSLRHLSRARHPFRFSIRLTCWVGEDVGLPRSYAAMTRFRQAYYV